MREFSYERPQTVDAAVAMLAEANAKALAGGTDLIPQMREGRRRADRVVDLKHIAELTAISDLTRGGVSIGAAASASAVARHPRIAAEYPAIADAARLIGSIQVQNRASLGGNVCNAAPSADAVPALLCHDAVAHIAGRDGRRKVPLGSLFQGPGRTTLALGELLVALELPAPPPRSAAAYLRFTPRREMDIAIAGAAAWIRLDGNGTIADARIALASVGPTPLHSPSAEARLKGAKPDRELFAEAGRLAAGDARPISDTRGSAEYRRTLVAVLTARALSRCCNSLGIKVDVA